MDNNEQNSNSKDSLKLSFKDILFEEQIKNLKEQSDLKAQSNYDTVTYFIINVIMSCNTLSQLECAKEWGLRLVKERKEMSTIVNMIIDQQYIRIADRWYSI